MRRRPTTGRPPRLQGRQKQQLRAILLDGAVKAGFATDIWSGKRVAKVIHDRFGIDFNPVYVPELLRVSLDFSWQKPDRKPRELDPAKVKKFLATWRDAKKTRRKDVAPSGSSTNLEPA